MAVSSGVYNFNEVGSCPPTESLIANDYSVYRELDPLKKQIRLLHVWPDEPDARLKCTLVTCSIDDRQGRYFALSYCWGDLADTEEIVLEHCFCQREEDDDDHQQTFNITKNLAAALRRFKAANQFVLIWVDALCINQGNRRERGQQVQLMQQIYSNAYSAIVWLGEGDDRSDAAMKDINTLYDAAQQLGVISNDLGVQYTPTRKQRDLIRSIYLKQGGMPSPDGPVLSQLADFFSRPWFRRVWVVQEVISSKRAVVFCGNSTTTWLAILVVREWVEPRMEIFALGELRHYPLPYPDRPPLLPDIWVYLCRTGGRGHLLELLVRSRLLLSTDPRDRIYALLGLAVETYSDDPNHLPPKPDYTKEISLVYNEFTRYMIDRYQSLDILSLSSYLHHRPFLNPPLRAAYYDRFPRWIPDLSLPLREDQYIAHHSIYRASGDLKPDVLASSYPEYLRVRGVRFDRITDVAPGLFTINDDCEVLVGGEKNGLQLIWDLCNNHRPSLSKNGLLKRILLTLTCAFPCTPSEAFGLPRLDSREPGVSSFKSGWPHVRRLLERSVRDVDCEDQADICEILRTQGLYEGVVRMVSDSTFGRRFFITGSGNLGLGPPQIAKDDAVVVLFGGSTPFILRPTAGYTTHISSFWFNPSIYPDSSERFAVAINDPPIVSDLEKIMDTVCDFIGECYVDGKMDGSVIKEWRRGKLLEGIFSLH